MISTRFERRRNVRRNANSELLPYHSCLQSVSIAGSSGQVLCIPSRTGAAVKPSAVNAAWACVRACVRSPAALKQSAVSSSTPAKPAPPQQPINHWGEGKQGPGPSSRGRCQPPTSQRSDCRFQQTAGSARNSFTSLLFKRKRT